MDLPQSCATLTANVVLHACIGVRMEVRIEPSTEASPALPDNKNVRHSTCAVRHDERRSLSIGAIVSWCGQTPNSHAIIIH